MLVLSRIRLFVLALVLLGMAAVAAAQPRPGTPDQTRDEIHKIQVHIARLDRERQALDVLREGLRKGEVDRVTIADLPPSLTRGAQALRGLQTVQQLARETRLKDREITALKEALASFLAGVRPLPEADAALGSRILQELAVRHFLQGHSREYRELMPAGGSPEHAARLLRDLKALTLGQGEVVTNPARVVLTRKENKGNAAPPDGVRMLLSDSARKSWRPPQAAGEKAEASPLEKAAEIGRTLAGKIQTEAVKERIKQEERMTEAYRLLEKAQRRLQASE